MRSKLIYMAGGGTAGHVNPNLALVEPLKKAGFQVEYLGQKTKSNMGWPRRPALSFMRWSQGGSTVV